MLTDENKIKKANSTNSRKSSNSHNFVPIRDEDFLDDGFDMAEFLGQHKEQNMGANPIDEEALNQTGVSFQQPPARSNNSKKDHEEAKDSLGVFNLDKEEGNGNGSAGGVLLNKF